MTNKDKKLWMGLTGAILSIPFAFLLGYGEIQVNPGWAFILGIAYAGIWWGRDDD